MLDNIINIMYIVVCFGLLISGSRLLFSKRKKSEYYEDMKASISENKMKFNFWNSELRYLVDDEVRAKVNKICGIQFLVLGILLLVIGLIELRWRHIYPASSKLQLYILLLWIPAYYVWYKLYPKVLYLEKHSNKS